MLNSSKKKENKNNKQDYIITSIEELCKGNQAYASILLEYFFCADKEHQKMIAQELLKSISDISIKKWYTLTQTHGCTRT